jgi:hypothetical protein
VTHSQKEPQVLLPEREITEEAILHNKYV